MSWNKEDISYELILVVLVFKIQEIMINDFVVVNDQLII
jgi:hypothetical protein